MPRCVCLHIRMLLLFQCLEPTVRKNVYICHVGMKDIVCEVYVRVVNRRTIHDRSKYLFMHKIDEILKKYAGREIRLTVRACVPCDFFSRLLYRRVEMLLWKDMER